MASSLTNRLCQVDSDDRNIAYEPFAGAMKSLLHGSVSINGVENYYQMTDADKAAFAVWVGQVTSAPTLVERMVRIDRFTSIIAFYEQGDVTTYQTPDEVETHILALDQGP